jgi:hypothetical protein
MLEADYSADNLTHTSKDFFWQHFYMNKRLFMRTVHGEREYDDYFMWKQDRAEMVGFSSIHKYFTTR